MPTLTKPLADYSHCRRAGDLVFISGQGCRDPKTNNYAGIQFDERGHVTGHDITAQALGVLTNIERALHSEGLSRRHLVDITVFLTDMGDFAAMNRVWNDFFRDCKPPTRTTVCVVKLPGHNFIEMKAIAAANLPD